MTDLYAFAGDTIAPADVPTVTLSRDVNGQEVLTYLEPESAAQLGLALIFAAIREAAGDFNVDRIALRAELVINGYGVEYAANLDRSRLTDHRNGA